MIKQEIKETQNIYLLPLLMTIIQFGFLFVALLGSNYFFEKKVLIISSLCVCIWGILFVVSILNGKIIRINCRNLIIILLFVFLCLCLIQRSWFANYLRIDAVKQFFEGRTFIDTLYHSAIAESIATNGYPSIQQNAPTFLSYHCLSHYIIAGISWIIGFPSYITYNYLFPIIFIPLFLFLMQKVVCIGKAFVSGKPYLLWQDYVVLTGCLLGFFTKTTQMQIACNIHSAIYNSESSLLAIILLLLYFYIIDKIGKIKRFESINLGLIIPFFILILSYAKISFGVIFMLGASYYVFRKYFPYDKKFIYLIEYFFIFYVYYIIQKKTAVSYPSPIVGGINVFSLFHHVRTYTKGGLYIVFHYLFLFFPVVCTICLVKDKFFKQIFTYKKECVFVEMCFLLMLGAIIPGAIIKIHGGSAFYFVVPVYVFSWIIFISYDVAGIFNKFFLPIKIIAPFHFKKNIYISLLVFILIISNSYIELHLKNNIIQTVRSRISTVGFKKDFSRKIKELFNEPAQIQYHKEYIIMNLIKETISHNPGDYCVFLSDNSDFIKKYDGFLRIGHPTVYYVRPFLAISAYLGLPVINSMYEHNGFFYRGDGKIFGDYKMTAGYSLPPALCDKKITKDNMIERAKKLDKKYIIVIEKNYYTIVNVK